MTTENTQVAPNIDLDDPVQDLCNALTAAGHPEPTAWIGKLKDICPEALDNNSPSIWRRAMVNRSLHLIIGATGHPEQMTYRYLLVDHGVHEEWKKLVSENVAPFMAKLARGEA